MGIPATGVWSQVKAEGLGSPRLMCLSSSPPPSFLGLHVASSFLGSLPKSYISLPGLQDSLSSASRLLVLLRRVGRGKTDTVYLVLRGQIDPGDLLGSFFPLGGIQPFGFRLGQLPGRPLFSGVSSVRPRSFSSPSTGAP